MKDRALACRRSNTLDSKTYQISMSALSGCSRLEDTLDTAAADSQRVI